VLPVPVQYARRQFSSGNDVFSAVVRAATFGCPGPLPEHPRPAAVAEAARPDAQRAVELTDGARRNARYRRRPRALSSRRRSRFVGRAPRSAPGGGDCRRRCSAASSRAAMLAGVSS
jgi:hypothetical protein